MMLYGLFFIAGGLIGFIIALVISKHKSDKKEAQYLHYQNQVAAHFEKTAALFAEIQARQDRLVIHLQEGARDLRKGMVPIEEVMGIEA